MKKKEYSRYGIVVLVIACIFIILAWWVLGKGANGEIDLTSLFTGLAFAGTIATLVSQKEELDRQRNLLLRQQFENTFHIMLNQLSVMVDGIEYGQNWFRGKSVFKDRYNSLKQRHEMWSKKKGFINVLDDFRNDKDYRLIENYFQCLFEILQFIDRPKYLSEESKQSYASILRSHLSTYELLMLFYHLFPYSDKSKSNQSFCMLVEKYKLLSNIEKDRIILDVNDIRCRKQLFEFNLI